MKTDVCIIGAGPAGLIAAIIAAGEGINTTIVDSNTVAGRKLLRTGRNRCNLTHTGSVDDFVKAYGRFGKFLNNSLSKFSAEDVREFFKSLNLMTKEDRIGRVFPLTDRATDVVRVMVDRARRLGVRFVYGKKVESIEKRSKDFEVLAASEKITSKAVIAATGGVTWPFTGSTGDGFNFAHSFGHKIIKPKGALVRLETKQKWSSQMQRVGIEKASVTAVINDKESTATGALKFTADGISGPAVFDLSRLLAEHLASEHEPFEVFLDFKPDLNEKDLSKLITDSCVQTPKKELAWVLTLMMPRALVLYLCEFLYPSVSIIAGQLSNAKRKELIQLIKHLPVTVVSARPIEEATITRGGICTGKIDPKTMQSKLCEGFFFAGEVMNVDGPTGGYNLQIAWSTGAVAGYSAANYCKQT